MNPKWQQYAILVCVIPTIAMKALRKLLVKILLAALFNFKMGAIINIFWPISQFLKYIESSKFWKTKNGPKNNNNNL